ncbi:MAG: tRNA adenosine(34) deaminase TadA [Acidobacteria bacterium]|nr:tRNA adenosine(34) deaminase TadA [Acidobacteriota bacterium]
MSKRQQAKGNDSVEVNSLRDLNSLDQFYMGFALAEATRAKDAGEVPIGAVVVFDNQIIGSGHNQPITLNDPTAHAEILAIRRAAERIGNYRLMEATLYVTIEPCAMCAGAMVNARIKRLVYGASEIRAGAVNSVFQICTNSSLNHQVEVTSGVEADKCRTLMQAFFKERRKTRVEDFSETPQ